MSLDDILNKTITIKDGIQMGIISSRVLSDGDLFVRVQTIMEKEKLPKTHAVEKVAELCRVCEDTVWKSCASTKRIMSTL